MKKIKTFLKDLRDFSEISQNKKKKKKKKTLAKFGGKFEPHV